MEKLYIREILDATRGTLLCGDPDLEVLSVSTNSKTASKGSLFIPIRGEKMDGHQFIESAFANGAVAAFTSIHDFINSDKTYIRVDDTLKAMQDLASYYRGKFDIPVIGITGSVGKTSTKEMIASVLSSCLNVAKTAGNLNGQIGLPQTILNIEKNHEVAIIEMGISMFCEMEKLSKVARPNFAVMTNIGVTHIENLKTRENILKEKLHIADTLTEGSVLFLNGDDELLKSIDSLGKFKVLSFGLADGSDFRAENIRTDGENTFFDVVLNGLRENVTIPVVGVHNVYNALVAIGLGLEMGLPMSKIKLGLLRYENLNMRQQIHRLEKFTIIDDSYNASPDSMQSALNVLDQVAVKGRKIAVLADMLELGDISKEKHFNLGKEAVNHNIDILITVGTEAKYIAKGARSFSETMRIIECESNCEAQNCLKEIVKKGDNILVKGSRGMHMEQIAQFLMK